MEKKSFLNLIILFLLVSLAKLDDDWIYFDYATEKAYKNFPNAKKVQPLYVSFDNGDTSRLNYYIKVEIKPNDNKIPPVLFDNYTKTIFANLFSYRRHAYIYRLKLLQGLCRPYRQEHT